MHISPPEFSFHLQDCYDRAATLLKNGLTQLCYFIITIAQPVIRNTGGISALDSQFETEIKPASSVAEYMTVSSFPPRRSFQIVFVNSGTLIPPVVSKRIFDIPRMTKVYFDSGHFCLIYSSSSTRGYRRAGEANITATPARYILSQNQWVLSTVEQNSTQAPATMLVMKNSNPAFQRVVMW